MCSRSVDPALIVDAWTRSKRLRFCHYYRVYSNWIVAHTGHLRVPNHRLSKEQLLDHWLLYDLDAQLQDLDIHSVDAKQLLAWVLEMHEIENDLKAKQLHTFFSCQLINRSPTKLGFVLVL
jgi:hypothetical protein